MSDSLSLTVRAIQHEKKLPITGKPDKIEVIPENQRRVEDDWKQLVEIK